MTRPTFSPISLRPATGEDTPFLRALYAGTRAREMQAAGWPPAAQTAFLAGQYDAQQRSHRQRHPGAAFDVILAAGQPVGRFDVDRQPDGLEVVNLILTPSCRGKGWGTRLLEQLFAEADAAGLPVRLYVDEHNRAQRLYRRLGFRETGREGLYVRMERTDGKAKERSNRLG